MDGEFDVTTMVDEDGSLTESFHESVPTLLGEGFEDFKGFADYKSLPELLKGAANAKRMVGQKTEGMIKLPGENATPEEMAVYRKAMGVPDSAEAYELKRPEGKQYDAEGEAAFKAYAHEHGWTPKQFQEAVSFFDQYEDQVVTKLAEAQVKENEAANKAFDEKYGAEAEKVRRIAGDAMVKLGFDKVIKKMDALKNDPDVADWFYDLAKKMLPGKLHEGQSPPPPSGKGLAGIYNHKTSEQLRQ